jgi:catechol 2,3-dioxygenase-like lactoylglutathione lyase family enzyme
VEQRVSVITLGVADTAKARTFYEALGWQGRSPDGDVVFFQAGGMVFSLWGREDLAKDSEMTDSGGWGGVTLAHNVRSTAEVDEIAEQVRAAGGNVLREPTETFYGGYAFIFTDPDGHPWEVSDNPGWKLDADGGVVLPEYEH